MSILNVNQIQPVGSGQTVTISAANITASSSTISASSFVGGVTVTSGNLTGISSVSTTNLTVNGNAYPSAGPLSNRNLIINGAMQVAQRGTSSTSQGYQTVDRFTSYFVGVSITQSQQSLTSGDPYNDGFRYFLRVANTATSSATNAYVQVDQPIEAQNIAQSGWDYISSTSYITCSFWARSSLSGTYYVQYRATDTSSEQINKSFTLTANTWKKVTHTIPGNSSVIINNDNGLGFQITVTPHYATDYTDSSVPINSWYTRTSSTFLPDYSQNWANTSSATFDLTGVQLEVGTVATPFEHRSYGDELARCQRYYYKLSAASNDRYFMGLAENSTTFYGVMHAPVTMRTDPTLETSGTATHFKLAYSTDTTCNALPTLANSTQNTALIGGAIVASGLTANQSVMLGSNSASSYLALTAEL